MSRARVENPLAGPDRVAALRGTGLLGGPKVEAFERLAGLAASFTGAPMAMVAVLDATHLHPLGRVGRADLARSPRTAVKETFCRQVVAAGEPLIVGDAREHELTKGLASVKSGKVLAYAGVPLMLPGGPVLGTLSVADTGPRTWKASELSVLEDLARSVVTEIQLRAEVEARRDLQRANDRLRGLLEHSPAAIYATDLEGNELFANAAAERLRDERGLIDAPGAVAFPLLDPAGEPYGTCGISIEQPERQPAAPTEIPVPVAGDNAVNRTSAELGSAKALLRRLETAVDAAQSALASALPEDDGPK